MRRCGDISLLKVVASWNLAAVMVSLLTAFVGLGAGSLILTDLNREVIVEDVTWPNVLFNCRSAEERQAVRCISGDWEDLEESFDNTNEVALILYSAPRLFTLKRMAKKCSNSP